MQPMIARQRLLVYFGGRWIDRLSRGGTMGLALLHWVLVLLIVGGGIIVVAAVFRGGKRRP